MKQRLPILALVVLLLPNIIGCSGIPSSFIQVSSEMAFGGSDAEKFLEQVEKNDATLDLINNHITNTRDHLFSVAASQEKKSLLGEKEEELAQARTDEQTIIVQLAAEEAEGSEANEAKISATRVLLADAQAHVKVVEGEINVEKMDWVKNFEETNRAQSLILTGNQITQVQKIWHNINLVNSKNVEVAGGMPEMLESGASLASAAAGGDKGLIKYAPAINTAVRQTVPSMQSKITDQVGALINLISTTKSIAEANKIGTPEVESDAEFEDFEI